MAAALSSGWHLLFLRNYFYLYAKCGLPEKEEKEKGKEKVKAPRTLTHALDSFALPQNPPTIFFTVHFAEKHTWSHQTKQICHKISLNPLFPNKWNILFNIKTVKTVKFNWLTMWKKDLLQNWGKKIQNCEISICKQKLYSRLFPGSYLSLLGETWLKSVKTLLLLWVLYCKEKYLET